MDATTETSPRSIITVNHVLFIKKKAGDVNDRIAQVENIIDKMAVVFSPLMFATVLMLNFLSPSMSSMPFTSSRLTNKRVEVVKKNQIFCGMRVMGVMNIAPKGIPKEKAIPTMILPGKPEGFPFHA